MGVRSARKQETSQGIRFRRIRTLGFRSSRRGFRDQSRRRLFRYSNGAWFDRTVIAPDRNTKSVDTAVSDIAEARNLFSGAQLVAMISRRVDPGRVGSSVGEDRQLEPAKALGVGDHVDFDDASPRDAEAEHDEQPSTRSHDDSHGAVHERRLCEPGAP
jgi:hypothetical protein